MKIANGYVTLRFHVSSLYVDNDDLLASMFPEGYDAECVGEDDSEVDYEEVED